MADIVCTLEAQQDWYATFNSAAWILSQLLTIITPVHNTNSPKYCGKDHMWEMMFQEIVWMQSVVRQWRLPKQLCFLGIAFVEPALARWV